jgi:hypothetical protein
MQAVHVPVTEVAARRVIGQILPVRIAAAHANSLSGNIDLTSNDLPSPISTDDLGPAGNTAETLGHVL